MSRVLGQVPNASSSSNTSHEGMDITTKVMFMYTICNLISKKEGRDKVTIEDCLLLNKIFDLGQVSLPKIVMKHLEHARSVQKHGILYGLLIRRILEYCEVYTEGTDPIVLEKPLNLKCLSQAFFKYDKKKEWHKVPRVQPSVEGTEGGEVLMLEGPGLV